MLTEYIRVAMQRAHYELIEDGTFVGTIPGLQGVLANAETLEGCRDELQSVLEDWLLVSLVHGDFIPIIEGIDLSIPLEKVA
jgi:predicted RNase H-like HicB family nuclease